MGEETAVGVGPVVVSFVTASLVTAYLAKTLEFLWDREGDEIRVQ